MCTVVNYTRYLIFIQRLITSNSYKSSKRSLAYILSYKLNPLTVKHKQKCAFQYFFIVLRYIFLDFQFLPYYNHLIKYENEVFIMKQKIATLPLKLTALLIALFGVFLFGGSAIYAKYAISPPNRYSYDYELSEYLYQNLVYIVITGILYFIILFFFWRIIKEIDKDNIFSMENAKNLKSMAFFSFLMILEFIIRTIIWLTTRIYFQNHLIYTLLAIFAILIFAILCLSLSKYVKNAYEIKQENELTI